MDYLLSATPAIDIIGIWWSVPIGWVLADLTDLLYYKAQRKTLLLEWLHAAIFLLFSSYLKEEFS